MTLSQDLRIRIINAINSGSYSNKLIMNIFDISKKTYYKFKKEATSENNNVPIPRKVKITGNMKRYVANHVIRNKRVNTEKIIILVKENFDTSISKASIYNILAEYNITFKKIDKKLILANPEKRPNDIIKFKEELRKAKKKFIIYLDETTIDSHLMQKYGWSRNGEIITLLQYNAKVRYSVITAIRQNNIRN